MKLKFWQVAVILGFIVLIQLQCNKCRHSTGPTPQLQEDKKEVEQVRAQWAADSHQKESVIQALFVRSGQKDDSIAKLTTKYDSLEEIVMRRRVDAKVAIEKVTAHAQIDPSEFSLDCGSLASDYDSYIALTDERQRTADSIIGALSRKNVLTDSIGRIRQAISDSAGAALTFISAKYEKLYLATAHRNQIFFGVNAMATKKAPVYAGVSIMLKTKGNQVYELGSMVGSNMQLYFHGGIKSLITFHK